MAKTIIAAQRSLSAGLGTIYTICAVGRILGDTTEDRRYILYEESGTFSNLFVNISANTVTANSIVTFRKNSAAGSQTLTVPSSTTGNFEDTTNTDTIVANDKVDIELANGATGTTITYRTVSVLFAATTNSATKYACFISSTTATTTTYHALCGGTSTGDAAEVNTKARIRQSGTFKNLYVRVRTNSKAGNTPFRFRKNGANSGPTVTVGSSATGDFEDTSNTSAVVAGDDVNYALETSVSGTFTPSMIGISLETTNGFGWLYGNAMTALTQAETLTRYYHLGGEIDTGQSGESTAQLRTRMSIIFSNLTIHITANTIAGTSIYKARVNGADGFSSCSIGSTATGYFTDTTNWEECDADDLVCAALVTPTAGGGQTITVRAVGVTTEPFAGATTMTEIAAKSYSNKFIVKV